MLEENKERPPTAKRRRGNEEDSGQQVITVDYSLPRNQLLEQLHTLEKSLEDVNNVQVVIVQVMKCIDHKCKFVSYAAKQCVITALRLCNSAVKSTIVNYASLKTGIHDNNTLAVSMIHYLEILKVCCKSNTIEIGMQFDWMIRDWIKHYIIHCDDWLVVNSAIHCCRSVVTNVVNLEDATLQSKLVEQLIPVLPDILHRAEIMYALSLTDHGYVIVSLNKFISRVLQLSQECETLWLDHISQSRSILQLMKTSPVQSDTLSSFICLRPSIVQRQIFKMILSVLAKQPYDQLRILIASHFKQVDIWASDPLSFWSYFFQLFSGNDSSLITALNDLLTIEQSLTESTKQQQQQQQQQQPSNAIEDILQLINPFTGLFQFLQYLCFDYSILLNFLISQETTVLIVYLLQICKYIGSNIDRFELALSESLSFHSETVVQYELVIHLFKELAKEIEQLVKHNLFPYNPTALLKNLYSVIDSYEPDTDDSTLNIE